jgi:peptidoglycan/xylan/chitin deacetylase (PgdA/CDA1 family)
MTSKLCAVSIDLDEIPQYYAIHGLAAPVRGSHAVYDVALGRLAELARALDVPLTLFVIAADVRRAANAARLRELSQRHEIGNHSLDHRYDLTRLAQSAIYEQIDEATVLLEQTTGSRPVGFRAPGYTVNDRLFEVLRDVGIRYDSSVFPCPPYYAAKALALGMQRILGRRSQSILDTPAVLRAPTRPYRIGVPYWRRGDGLLELPIQVTRGARLPFIGTTLTLAGPTPARWLARSVIGEPLVNLELHGIDALDADDDLESLRSHQPDVRVPRARKLDAIAAAIETLREAGYGFVTLQEAAATF